MDAVRAFVAQLLSSAGIAMNQEAMVIAGFAIAVLVVVIVLVRGRRGHRLEDPLADPRQLQGGAPLAEPRLRGPGESAADAHSDWDETKQRSADLRWGLEAAGNSPRISAGPAIAHPVPGANFRNTRTDTAPSRESPENHQGRIELLQATLASLQQEQHTLRKLLEACTAGLQGLEQFLAAVPGIRAEHAAIAKQLAELNARFETTSEVLAGLLQSEERSNDR